jgi:hypothetical protein
LEELSVTEPFRLRSSRTKSLLAEVPKVTVDIDHLEASIRLFDPEVTPNALKAYVVKHAPARGR